VKWYREKEKEGSHKKKKGYKLSLDPIALTEGDLDDIGDKVQDIIVELL